MANPSIAAEKRAQRERFRALLATLDAGQRSRWSERIVAALADWLSSDFGPCTVAVYAAFGTEVDLDGLPPQLAGSSFLYPRVVAGGLEFRAVPDPGGMARGHFGIREPDPARHALVAPAEIDVCLCPGLAFAADGVRLGRGKGYYDHALCRLRPDVPRVGVGFAVQQVATLPHEAHDIGMTHLVSEEGLRQTARPNRT